MTRLKFLASLFTVIVSCFTLPTVAQTLSSKTPRSVTAPLRLFIIGNSFSQNASKYLPQLALDGGHELIIGRAELGGCPLQRHWESVEAEMQNPQDPKGKPYKDKSLKMMLSEGTWDVVTIQQYSMISGDQATYQPYAKKLVDFIRSIQPKAKIVFHETWAYRSDAEGFGLINGKLAAKDQEEMYQHVSRSYKSVAKELGLEVIRTGDAFHAVDTDPEWQFKRDTKFDYSSPVYPQLPDQKHSLHAGYSWNNSKKFTFDSHHASPAGCYLGGLVWYRFLFNESPEKLSFKPAEVEERFASYLRRTSASLKFKV